jgi:hypothetical protein
MSYVQAYISILIAVTISSYVHNMSLVEVGSAIYWSAMTLIAFRGFSWFNHG